MAKRTPLQEALDDAQFFVGKRLQLPDGSVRQVGAEIPEARNFPNLVSWIRSGHVILKGAVSMADLQGFLVEKQLDPEKRFHVRKNRDLEEAGDQDPYLLRNARRAKSSREQDLGPARKPPRRKKKKVTRTAKKKKVTRKAAKKSKKRKAKKTSRKASKRTST